MDVLPWLVGLFALMLSALVRLRTTALSLTDDAKQYHAYARFGCGAGYLVFESSLVVWGLAMMIVNDEPRAYQAIGLVHVVVELCLLVMALINGDALIQMAYLLSPTRRKLIKEMTRKHTTRSIRSVTVFVGGLLGLLPIAFVFQCLSLMKRLWLADGSNEMMGIQGFILIASIMADSFLVRRLVLQIGTRRQEKRDDSQAKDPEMAKPKHFIASRETPERVDSALRENIMRKGENSYYFAHAKTPIWENINFGGAPARIDVSTTNSRDAISKLRISISKYSFADSTGKVCVYFGHEDLPRGADTVYELEFTDTSVRVHFDDTHVFRVKKLFRDISSAKMKSTKEKFVLVMSKKNKTETWKSLSS